MRNATVIPNGRDNTYDPTEVSRRTAEEHYENSFSEDERTGLESKFSGGSSGGGGAEPLIVHMNYHEVDNYHVLDKTWQEIYDAPMAWLEAGVLMPGGLSTHKYPLSDIFVLQPTGATPLYGLNFGGVDSGFDFSTNDANGYPTDQSVG